MAVPGAGHDASASISLLPTDRQREVALAGRICLATLPKLLPDTASGAMWLVPDGPENDAF